MAGARPDAEVAAFSNVLNFYVENNRSFVEVETNVDHFIRGVGVHNLHFDWDSFNRRINPNPMNPNLGYEFSDALLLEMLLNYFPLSLSFHADEWGAMNENERFACSLRDIALWRNLKYVMRVLINRGLDVECALRSLPAASLVHIVDQERDFRAHGLITQGLQTHWSSRGMVALTALGNRRVAALLCMDKATPLPHDMAIEIARLIQL